MTQACIPYFPFPSNSQAQPPSRIINLSSVGARAGFANLSVYAASKAAVEAFTRCWAAELGERGITVNAVSPGPVETDMLGGIPDAVKERQREATPLGKRLGTEGCGGGCGVAGWRGE
jgi:3-oxoacyl-[acyl-carrier protein] reductase